MNEYLEIIRRDRKLVVLEENDRSIKILSKHSNKIVRIPLKINPELSFLSGIIIGDGHLNKNDYRISLEMTSLGIVELVADCFRSLFDTKVNIKRRERPRRKVSWRIDFYSKPIWKLFNVAFEIPSGKKSGVVTVPKVVVNDKDLSRAFVSGMFLSDGGFRRGKVLFSTSSCPLHEGLWSILRSFDIHSSKSVWIHKYSNRPVYDLVIYRKTDNNRFKEEFPLTSYKTAGVP